MTTQLTRELSLDDGQLFIDGRFRDATSGLTDEVIDPARGTALCRVARGGAEDVDLAVAAARRAFTDDAWAGLSQRERSRLLLRVGQGMLARAEEFALRESLDVGKPIAFSRGFDVPAAADLFFYYAGICEQLEGAARPAGRASLAYTRREPLGVVGAITPFNFPLNLSVNKIAPALAAGNTFVHKPAEQTPLSALLMAEVIADAGVPAGVFNVVTGDGPSVGAALAAHPDVVKLAFTGSTEVGRRMVATGAETLKHVTVELGGKGANIVFADADLDAAVPVSVQAAFFNTGQFCMSGPRLVVHRSVHDEVVGRIVAALDATVVGDPLDEATQLGPLAHEQQLAKVVDYVRIGLAEGATLAAGGHPGRAGDPTAAGFFHEPTVFTGVLPGMRIAQEEIFGPVLTVLAFEDDDEAVAIANGTPYGLAAGLHTRDLRRAHRIAARLQAGIVWVNTWGQFESSTPFGGYKQSGYGRELGPEGIEEYLQYKTVLVNVD